MTTPNPTTAIPAGPTSTGAPPNAGPPTSTGARTRAAARRIRALSRAELRLLVRNKTAMITALAMPVLLVVSVFGSVGDTAEEHMELGSFIVVSLIGFALLFVVYYNLVTAYVARREDLVLKRLRTSEATDIEILTGTAVPGLAIALGQVLVAVVAAVALLDLGAPVNPLLVMIAFLGGAAVFVLLAAASTAFTRTAETAQVSTLPVVMVSMVLSGSLVPIDVYPDAVQNAAQYLPLSPVVELTRLGLEGTADGSAPVGFADTFVEALAPSAILLAWLYLGVYAARRWFRWEPRT
ncbi:ABC transporter permease [Phytoactinopolyspora endophytica]|uniref:ABC transporter permease n=1 Tax=Phytoactinopolyspora endophytica TaxID=1642495 RepID=UPI0013EA60F4|nr:ABC transporter permease [Phytoactinopolyspora endophytica]